MSSGEPARLSLEDVHGLVSRLAGFSKPPGVLGFSVEAFSGESLGYLGVHELLRVEVAEEEKASGPARSLSFFLKSKNPQPVDFDELVFREEGKFLGCLAPRLLEASRLAEPWAAECYLATQDLLVLEDLRARGFRAPNRPLLPAELRAGLGCLGRLHASSLLLEARLGQALDRLYPGYFREKVFVEDGTGWKWLAAGIQLVEAVARELGREPGAKICEAYRLTIDRSQPAGPTDLARNVLCHCDLWFNNLMFDAAGRCRLVDFQMVAYTSLAVDLAQILYLNLEPGSRRKLEPELIQTYHAALDNSLRQHGYAGPKIGLPELARDLEEKRICGLVAAVQFLPVALWDKEAAAAYSSPETCLHYMYTSRTELVQRAMRRDDGYRRRIEGAVAELLDYMDNLPAQ